MTTIRLIPIAARPRQPAKTWQLESVAALTTLGARGLLSMIFIASGLGKIADFSATQGYMAAKGMPLTALFLIGAIVVEVLGGLAVLSGYKARWSAAALFLFLIPASLIFHNFWAFDGMERQMQMIHFMKNLSIMGGLLFITAHGAGRASLDARLAR